MIYLDSFHFPTFEEEDDYLSGYFCANPSSMETIYPFKVLSVKGLHSLDFTEITILYGGNGSGSNESLQPREGQGHWQERGMIKGSVGSVS